MSGSPPKKPGRIESGYNAFARGLTRVLTDVVAPITAFVIIYAILFGKVKEPTVALMLGGAASAFLGIPFWTRQDRARRNGRDDDDSGPKGFTISIGRPPPSERERQPDRRRDGDGDGG